MASHITKCTGSIIPPATPVERQQSLEILLLGCGAQPQVEIQFRRNGVLPVGSAHTLRPYRSVRITIYGVHIADLAGIVPILQHPHAVARGPLVAHLGHHLVPVRRLGQFSGLINIMCQRLLYIDVLVELHGGHGGHGVGMVRRGHGAGIQMLALFVQHHPEVLVIFRLGEFLAHLHRGAVVHVTQESDLRLPAVEEVGQVALPFPTGTDTAGTPQ